MTLLEIVLCIAASVVGAILIDLDNRGMARKGIGP